MLRFRAFNDIITTHRFVQKKYDEARGIWQARVNKDWRFYFNILGDTYIIRDIIPHPMK